MADTDSFVFHVKFKSHDQSMTSFFKKYKHLFDFSNYDKNHELYDSSRAKDLGLFKNELPNSVIFEFAAVKPKLYSILYDFDRTKMAAKGIKKYCIRHHVRHEMFKKCIFDSRIFYHKMNMIRSKDHQLYNVELRKLSLNPYCNKRFLLDDGIHSLSYGNYHLDSLKEGHDEGVTAN